MVFRRAAFRKGLLESSNCNGKRWYVFADWRQHIARDVQRPVFLLDLAEAGHFRPVSDIGEVVDSVQDLRNAGSFNGRPSVSIIVYRQPNANIIETVDRVRELLPELQASIPNAIDVAVGLDADGLEPESLDLRAAADGVVAAAAVDGSVSKDGACRPSV